VAGRGIIIDEPSVVAVRTHRGMREVVAVGRRAIGLAARARETLELVRPLREGVIADFVAAEEMLRDFLRRAKTMLGFRRPRILICVPAAATPVERRAVYQTAQSVGARKVFLIAEPVAACIGADLPVDATGGTMLVDIGGGSTDIAVLSHGRIVEARTLRCAGHAMDDAIVRYVRRKHRLLIGEANAERIKIEAGTVLASVNGRAAEVHLKGRDVRDGRLKSVVLTAKDIEEALRGPIDRIGEFVELTLEDLLPDVLSDIARNGVHLTGGGALLDKLDVALSRRVGIKFHVAKNPMHCVIKGTAAILAEVRDNEHLLMQP